MAATGGGNGAGELSPESGIVLFDFDAPADVAGWSILTDRIMGGRSRAAITDASGGVALFSGEISLDENSAGFAQARSSEFKAGFPSMGGWRVRLRGDGKHYMMSTNVDDSHPGVYYRMEFATRKGEWEIHDFPFEAFKPFYRGFWVAHGRIEGEKIKSIGFMIAEKQAGAFALEIDWIRVIPATVATPSVDAG